MEHEGYCFKTDVVKNSSDPVFNETFEVPILEVDNPGGIKLKVLDWDRFTKDDAEWGAVIVNIGCIGVMAEITLDLVPDHDYELTMYRNIPCAHLIKHWREMAESCGGPGQVSQIQVLGNWWGPQASMSVACRRLVPPHSPQITNDDCEPTFFGEVRAHHLHLHYQRALLLSPFLLSLPLR